MIFLLFLLFELFSFEKDCYELCGQGFGKIEKFEKRNGWIIEECNKEPKCIKLIIKPCPNDLYILEEVNKDEFSIYCQENYPGWYWFTRGFSGSHECVRCLPKPCHCSSSSSEYVNCIPRSFCPEDNGYVAVLLETPEWSGNQLCVECIEK